jgi:hypothetical protein
MTTLTGLNPGQYDVTITPAGQYAGWLPWMSHSLPAAGKATAEPGLTTRAITMFRPPARVAPVRIGIEDDDVSVPWAHVVTQGLQAGESMTFSLVPASSGRTDLSQMVTVDGPADEADFPNLDPGLYANYVHKKSGYNQVLRNTPGFLWVPSDSNTDTVPSTFASTPWASLPAVQHQFCVPTERQALPLTPDGKFFATGPDKNGDGVIGDDYPYSPCDPSPPPGSTPPQPPGENGGGGA